MDKCNGFKVRRGKNSNIHHSLILIIKYNAIIHSVFASKSVDMVATTVNHKLCSSLCLKVTFRGQSEDAAITESVIAEIKVENKAGTQFTAIRNKIKRKESDRHCAMTANARGKMFDSPDTFSSPSSLRENGNHIAAQRTVTASLVMAAKLIRAWKFTALPG